MSEHKTRAAHPFARRSFLRSPFIPLLAALSLAGRSFPRSPLIPSLAAHLLTGRLFPSHQLLLTFASLAPRSPLIYSLNLDSLAQPVLTLALFLLDALER